MSFNASSKICNPDNKPNFLISTPNYGSLTLVVRIVASLLLVVAVTGCEPSPQNASPPETLTKTDSSPSINIVSPDWGNAATLIAMGYPPIATGDIRVWDQWVRDPKVPDSVVDLGIRYQPNVELIAQLPVDMVVDNFFYQHARGLYEEGVATESVTFAAQGSTATWSDYSEPTRELGEIINEPELAEAYIANSQTKIVAAGKVLDKHYPKVNKFAVVQFVDANNLRMFVANSLFQVAFNQMDKQLVSTAEGNKWGFVPITLSDLAKLDNEVCLLMVEPMSPITRAEIKKNLIWQRLDYGKTRCYGELPPVWIYGGMSSVVTLANSLAEASLTGGVAQ